MHVPCWCRAAVHSRTMQLSWQRRLRWTANSGSRLATEALLCVCAPYSIPLLAPMCTPAPPAAGDAVDCAAGSGQALAPATDGAAPQGALGQARSDHACSTGLPQAASPPALAAAMGASALGAPVDAGSGLAAAGGRSASTPASAAELGSLSLAGLLLDRRAGGKEGMSEGCSRGA